MTTDLDLLAIDEGLDEDFELDLEDVLLPRQIAAAYKEMHPNPLPRRVYYTELLRLQSELIKLQDWVSHSKEKIVVLFEGRDSAGKGRPRAAGMAGGTVSDMTGSHGMDSAAMLDRSGARAMALP